MNHIVHFTAFFIHYLIAVHARQLLFYEKGKISDHDILHINQQLIFNSSFKA